MRDRPQERSLLFYQSFFRFNVPYLVMTNLKKTVVYVDGFNLYYGCLKATPYRWLNLLKLSQLLLPTHEILQIKYFTALVTSRPKNPDQATRQQTYLRALQTIPNLQII